MTNKDIFKAVGDIPNELIDEAAAPRRPRRGALAACASLAACAAIAIALWQPWSITVDEPGESEPAGTPANGVFVPAEPWEAVYIPPEPMPEAASGYYAADMIGFFIRGGRMYTQTAQSVDISLLGDYLFSPTGDIDEWSGSDEYVEGASSVAGEVYTVRGYDEGFRLALVSGGTAELYDSLGGRTLTCGADLFESCLHVENYVGAYCVADADWEQETARRRELDAGALEPFIATLLASPMQNWGHDGENGDIYSYGYAEAHLYLTLADGTTVPLRLFENGCVKYDGSAARFCAYMPGAIFDEVFSLCR